MDRKKLNYIITKFSKITVKNYIPSKLSLFCINETYTGIPGDCNNMSENP